MSPDGSSIYFERCPRKLDRKRLRLFLARLEQEVTGQRAFTCLITHDEKLQELNREFLNHDYPTDVLSFPSGGGALLGDLAISLERAMAQAEQFGHPLEAEIEILMLHGALHLMGMDHETDRGKMARLETKWRKALGLGEGLIARSRRKS